MLNKLGLLVAILLYFSSSFSQIISKKFNFEILNTINIGQPDLEALKAEDEIRDRNGEYFRIGHLMNVNFSPANSGTWTTSKDGDREWKLRLKANNAQGLGLLFDQFVLFGNSSVTVYDIDGNKLSAVYTAKDNEDHQMQHIPLCNSDELIVVLKEPKGATSSQIHMNEVSFIYRSLLKKKSAGESESCQNNINCTEAVNWQDEKKGVARILVTEGNSQGWCSGSLINNVKKDCKPYFLTALHCGVNATTANLNQWKFYFNFELAGCTGTPTESLATSANTITGCGKLATSNDGGGDTGSDFLLVRLGTVANETTTISKLKTIGAYWNGFDANNTTVTGGAGIHHPSGDVKKISFFTGATTTSAWDGNGLQSHWRLTWSDGVTEGGSSGSPLFNNNNGNSRIIGTLTGGSSYCSAQTSPDFYGKMSYHWNQNTTSGNIPLKQYLDPDNSGTLIIDGSYDPCSVVTAPPVADFNADQTNVNTNTLVTITNSSTNNPTTNSWAITPATGWSYSNGTSASSSNIQVTFTTVGTYTVSLVATNAIGSNTKTKTSYITVTQPTTLCVAGSSDCDEYIAKVELNTLTNTSTCSNYTMYTNKTTTLTKGQTYTLKLSTGIVGSSSTLYTGDQVAAWIDYNNDLSLVSSERIFYQTSSNFTGTASFTVPMTAQVGSVYLRVKIGYEESANCGVAEYGEVEDYKITIVEPTSTASIENQQQNHWNLYPNPASTVLTIESEVITSNEDVLALIYDVSGKLVKQIDVQGGMVDIEELSTGMYQLHLLHNQQISKLKFIKQ